MATTCSSITGNATFNNNSKNYKSIIGSATYTGSALNKINTNPFNSVSAQSASTVQWYENNVLIVSAVSSIYNISSNTITISNSAYEIKSTIPAEIASYKNNQSLVISPILSSSSECAYISGNPIFNDSSKNYGQIIGNPTFNGFSENGKSFENVIYINNTPLVTSISEGNPLSLKVNVVTQDALSVKWYKNDVPIPSSNNLTYTINSITTANSGTYTVGLSTLTYQIKSKIPSTITVIPSASNTQTVSGYTLSSFNLAVNHLYLVKARQDWDVSYYYGSYKLFETMAANEIVLMNKFSSSIPVITAYRWYFSVITADIIHRPDYNQILVNGQSMNTPYLDFSLVPLSAKTSRGDISYTRAEYGPGTLIGTEGFSVRGTGFTPAI